MAPDRGHLHHKLIDHGLSQKQAVALIYAMCIVLCLFAIFLLATGAVKIVALLLIVALFVVFMVITPRIMHVFNEEQENNERK